MFSLRSKTLRSIKANFPKMYSSILCPLCKKCDNIQDNLLLCKELQNILPLNSHIEYARMRGSTEQQTEFLKVYEEYLQIRDKLLDCSSSGLQFTRAILWSRASSGCLWLYRAGRGEQCYFKQWSKPCLMYH